MKTRQRPEKKNLYAPIGKFGQSSLVTFVQNAELIEKTQRNNIFERVEASKKNKQGVSSEIITVTYKTPAGTKCPNLPINADKLLKLAQDFIISTDSAQVPGKDYGLFYIKLHEQVIKKKYKGIPPKNGISREELKEERKVQREAINCLKELGVTIRRSVKRKQPNSKKWARTTITYQVDSLIQTEMTIEDEPNIIFLRLNSDLVDYILEISKKAGNQSKVINITDAIMGIDGKHPNAYNIGQAIMRHYNNYANRTEAQGKTASHDRLTVKTLLKETNYNFSLKEIKERKKKWQFYRKKLEADLNHLIAEGAIDDWGYSQKLNPKIEGVTRYDILNAEPQTDTEKDQIEALKNSMKEIDKEEKEPLFYSYKDWKDATIFFKAENPTDEKYELVSKQRTKKLNEIIAKRKEREGR